MICTLHTADSDFRDLCCLHIDPNDLTRSFVDLQVYQHWTKDVTHIIAAQKDAKFHAHVKQQRDVVSLEWLHECEEEQALAPIKPHHYLHLSKKTLQEVPDVCCFGDL